MADDSAWSVQLLEHLVGLESPSGDVERLATLRDVLVAEFAAAGVAVEIEPGDAGDHLVADLPGSGAGHVLVVGHYDTVWPAGRLAEAPFTITGDLATGPGVFDMKAGLVSLLWAVRQVQDLPHPVRIVLTADEEVGSPSGAGVVTAACHGAVAVYGLEPPLADGTLKVGRRGVARFRLSVTGKAAHAGLDADAGLSAIDELVDQLNALRAAVPGTSARSLNVGRIAGGTRANVVAGAAEAEIGARFATAADEAALVAAFDTMAPVRAGASVRVESLSRRPAWEPERSQALASHVVSLAARLGENVFTDVSGGAGDTNLTGAAGVPTVDGLGPRGKGAHAPGETVEVPSILQRGRLLRDLFFDPLP
jgi:glutamate carboxypeptidase